MTTRDKQVEAQQKVISGEAWRDFCDLLKSAGQLVIDNSEADELERAEGFRYLARLTMNNLGSMDPASLNPPTIDYGGARIGADNPDFMYGKVRVTGAARYRITGKINDVFTFNIGAFHGQLGTQQGLQSSGFLPASALQLDEEGSFAIIASCDKPEEEGVDWLQMVPETNSFLVRQTILQPGIDEPAEIDVRVIDGDVSTEPRALTAERLDQSLGRTAMMLHGIVQQFLGWTNDFKKRPNTISEINPELLGMAKGDPNCQYNYGYFDLADDEVLCISLQPPECEYWNIQLANHWMESFDTSDAVSAINLASAVMKDDGSCDIIVSATDPGKPNWLDTQFHQRGTIALRWVGAESKQADPLVRVCAIAELD